MTAARSPDAPAPSVAVTGHFGEWIQGCMAGVRGSVALVTVACPPMAVRARHVASGPLRLSGPAARAVPLDRALRLAGALGVAPQTAGHIALYGDAPAGGGAGASTAGLVALARIWAQGGSGCTPDALARACLHAEGASDPLMYPAPDQLLWAPRAGEVLARMAAPLPRMAVLAGFWGQGQVTDATDTRFPDIAPLWADWQSRPLTPARLAALARQSAQAATALRGPDGDPTDALAHNLGALGWLRAHTGSARGLIFAPGAVPPHGIAALCEAGLTGVFSFATGGT